MMSNKKIIFGSVIAYVLFCIVFISANFLLDNYEFIYNKEKPVIIEDINSNIVEVTQDDKKMAKESLYPYKNEEKIGYKNLLGEIVKEPTYSYGGYFVDGYAIVGDDDKIFVINSNFEKVSDGYDTVMHLNNGYFQGEILNDKNTKVYLINVNDNMVKEIECEYIDEYKVNNDYIEDHFIAIKDGKEYLINKEGNIVLKEGYDEILTVNKVENELRIWAIKNGEYILLSEKDQIPLDYNIIDCTMFSEGYSVIYVERKNGDQDQIVIDKDGKKIEFFNDYLYSNIVLDFKEGIVLLEKDDGGLVAINSKLDVIFKLETENDRYEYYIYQQYQNDKALVSRYDYENDNDSYNDGEEFFFIDKEGNLTEITNSNSDIEVLEANMYISWEYNSMNRTGQLYDKDNKLISKKEYNYITDKGEYVLAQVGSNIELFNKDTIIDIYYKGEKMNQEELEGTHMNMIHDNIIEIMDKKYRSKYYTCINGKLEQIDYYSNY